ncbi:hypothetical protein [Rhizobium halophilum]|uniref:hypothetical protein n=1 Tax=Rhizobium halophilum TaxID=2846852 RepID=UPI001EFE575C|nr:hypothetical protein [Rhizobium halophilum]MCF6369916.1 hypothetical protein [Rhizobium halophilum]
MRQKYLTFSFYDILVTQWGTKRGAPNSTPVPLDMESNMAMSAHIHVKPEDHILTLQEAIEPVYNRLALECEARIVDAAVKAGWSADEAVAAIEDLRKRDVLESRH